MNRVIKKADELKWIPDGFHFMGPKESQERRILLNGISELLNNRGFSEVIPSSFDFTSSFNNHLSPSDQARILKTKDLSGNEISPSIDLTVQVVKGMAGFSHQEENQNVFYVGKIIHDSINRNGSRREFLQLGVEILGSSGQETFGEIFSIISEILIKCKFNKKLTIVIGNHSVFNEILEFLKLSGQEKTELSAILYSKDSARLSGFCKTRKIPDDFFRFLEALMLLFKTTEIRNLGAVLSQKYKVNLGKTISMTEELLQLNVFSKNSQMDPYIDFSIIRDLNYYTGFVFHAYCGNISEPIFMGGAYDHLYAKFSGIEKPACGFAVTVDLLEEILRS
ncbi:MAG: ATP phosphoribosyltransferase regulatory subunit [Leptospira sp.]|nr:ATP phosphoribosyltransferase regulatory subunit [Leptospira sp.]